MTIRLGNDTLSAEFTESTGALAALTHAATGWDLLGRPELGQSFRLLVPLDGRRNNQVHGVDQDPPKVEQDATSVTFIWPAVRSEHGGEHPIGVTQRWTLDGGRLVVATTIDNHSEYVVEDVHAPFLGDVQPPSAADRLDSFTYNYGSAAKRPLWPTFANTPGYYGVDVPTQLNEGAASFGAPTAPFTLLQSAAAGLYVGVDEASPELVVWQSELHPGYGDSLEWRVPESRELDGVPVALQFAAVHIPFVAAGESRTLTPIALVPYAGDWQTGADVYRSWRDGWMTVPPPPDWAADPHSWQQIQINSPEDELRVQFADLVEVGRECAERGVAAIQLVGWNDGGQDKNNPSHVAEPRLGGAGALRDAIKEIQALGVKVILFTKFTWADRATERFRTELVADAVKDPYGDYYHYAGYRYETTTQLLDINTRRLIPMCFSSEHYLQVCAEEFQRVLDLGADGILFDECLHHTPALLCFDTSHGHRYGQPVYANDRELIRRFKEQAGDSTYLFAGEALYDWEFEEYQLSYHRSENPNHVPLSRYLLPHAPIMTAATGYDDRGMINQCLLYRYVISYEPRNFKGRLTDIPRTVAYGQKMDALRTELREWLWDATYAGTRGAAVTDPGTGAAHHPYSVFEASDGRAVVVSNDDPAATREVEVAVDGGGPLRWRSVDDPQWHDTDGRITLPPRTAVVVLPRP